MQLEFLAQPFVAEQGQTLHTIKCERGGQEASLFIHGFGDSHNKLFEQDYIVDFTKKDKGDFIFFDLLGHGLSSGKRGSIDDFSEYIESLKDLIEEAVEKYEKVKLIIWGNSCLLGLSFFKKYFLLTNEKISEIIFVDPYFHSNKKLMSFLFQVDLPGGMEELYEIRRNSEEGFVTETLTWKFWRQYLKAYEHIGEALYFVRVPIKFIETRANSKVERTISALKKLIIHTQCDHLYYNSKEENHEDN